MIRWFYRTQERITDPRSLVGFITDGIVKVIIPSYVSHDSNPPLEPPHAPPNPHPHRVDHDYVGVDVCHAHTRYADCEDQPTGGGDTGEFGCFTAECAANC